jgi:TM2 domain-containing membrane protein YozV
MCRETSATTQPFEENMNETKLSQTATETPLTTSESKPSEFWTVFLLGLFLGFLGVHRFYAKKFKSGAIQLVTLGLCGLWTLVDVVIILLSKFKNSAGVLYRNPKPKVAWGIFAVVCVLVIMAGANGPNNGGSISGGSGSGHSSSHKSARQLITDYAKDHYGRDADVEIEGGFAGGSYQVTVRTRVEGGTYDGGINRSSYTVTVDESAQQIKSWEMYDHN